MALVNGITNKDFTLSQQVDVLSDILVVPVNKLDADQYSAEDLDGITESVFGSGNMNYLSLQSAQTNESIATINSDNYSESSPFISAPAFAGGTGSGGNLLAPSSYNDENERDSSISTDSDRTPDNTPNLSGQNNAEHGNFTHSTIGSLSASTLSSDAGSFNSDIGISIFNSGNNESTLNIKNDGDTTNTTNNTTNIDNSSSSIVDETIHTVTNMGDELIQNIFEGDLIDIINTLAHDLTEINTLITNILNQTSITNLTETIINNISNIVTNILNETLGDLSLSLSANVIDTLKTDLAVTLQDSLKGALGNEITAEGIHEIVERLTGVDLPLVPALNTTLNFDLLNANSQYLNSAGDTDILINGLDLEGLTGIQIPDISLDLVEALVGDIDLALNLEDIPLNPDDIMAAVQDLGLSLQDLDLSNLSNVLDVVGDQVLQGAYEIELLNNVLENSFDTTVGELTGDLLSGDVLGNILPEDITSLLDPILEQPLDLVQNVVETLTDGGDVLDTIGDLLSGDPSGNPLPGDLPSILDPVLDQPIDLVQDITGHLTDEGGALDALNGLLGGSDPSGEPDLVIDLVDDVAGLQPLTNVVEVILDPVEAITGDIDIISDLGLLGDGNINNAAGDSDLTLDTDIDLLGIEIPDLNIDIPLDPIEAITGDLDIDLDVNLDLLDSLGTDTDLPDSPITDALESWTETIIGSGPGLFDDIIAGNIGGSGTDLPDPVGAVAEGIGALIIPQPTQHHGGLFGGLFG